MKYSTARLVVSASLSALLTLGVAGCSVSSSTTSETTTSVSDGETTTTTTTKTTDGATSTETTTTSDKTTDVASANVYNLDAYGVHYNLVTGYTFTEATTDKNPVENAIVVFNAKSDDGQVTMQTFTTRSEEHTSELQSRI